MPIGLHSLGAKIGIVALLMAGGSGIGTLVATGTIAHAQAGTNPGLVGAWYGEIENLGSEPGRMLDIKEDGTCYWGVYTGRKKPKLAKSTCKLDHHAGKIDLVTIDKHQVTQTLADKVHLKGYFLAYYRGGFFPHPLEMRRMEHPEQYTPR